MSTAIAVLNSKIASFEQHQLDQLNALATDGQFTVDLKSCGNPDFFQDPDQPLEGVPEIRAHVDSLLEASALCRRYIKLFDLGSGNWSGGEVVRVSDGLVIGSVSYNGRIWDSNRSEIAA